MSVMDTPAPLKPARKVHASAAAIIKTIAAEDFLREQARRRAPYWHLPLWASETMAFCRSQSLM
jgi:hypothetical protein